MKTMRQIKRFPIAFLCLLIVLLCVSPLTAARGDGDELIVGVPTDRCPIFYVDNNTGEIDGIGADLMRAAAENAGYKASFRQIKVR